MPIDTRKLIRLGGKKGSLVVSLPQALIKQLGWKEKQKVSVKKINGALVIRDWKKR
jgi:antitoxin component of MazEF toxin-antitoxin module